MKNQLSLFNEKKMTVKEIAELCDCTEFTVKECIHNIYPTLLKNGIKAKLSINQCEIIIGNIRKKGFIEKLKPIENQQVQNLQNLDIKKLMASPILEKDGKNIKVECNKHCCINII